MTQAARNLGIFLLALPIALVLSGHLYFYWVGAFISGRSFTAVLTFFSGVNVLRALFYLLFFTIFWVIPAALLRSAKPYLWACSFGVVVLACHELLTTHYVILSEPGFAYVRRIVDGAFDTSGALLGCVGAAYIAARIRQAAPNYSLKRTDQSHRD